MPRPGVGSPSSPSVLLLAKDCTPWTYGPSGPGEVGSRYRHPPQRLASGRAATRRNNLRQFSQTNVMACASRPKSTPPQPSMTPPSSPRRAGSSLPSHPLRGSILATFLLLLLLEDLRHVARCLGPRRMACGRILLLAAIGSGKREGSGSDHFRAQDALLTSKSHPPPNGPAPPSPSSSLSSSPQDTTTEVRKRARRSGRKTSTSSSDPCEQHLAQSARLGHVGRLGTELGALEQGKGMRGLTDELASPGSCSFVVESVERRMNSAALYR